MASVIEGDVLIEHSELSRLNLTGNENVDADTQKLLVKMRREITTLRREVQRLSAYRALAYRDCLTNLHNRRYFYEQLNAEQERSDRNSDYHFSVLVIDINDFKKTNDTFGHVAGDLVLAAIAEFFTDNLRKLDLCCRLGGDEFAVLLPSTKASGAKNLVKRLMAQFEKQKENFPVKTSFSLGLAGSDECGANPSALMEAADKNMYAEKRDSKVTNRRRKASRAK